MLGSKTIVSNEQADWGRDATREKVISAVSEMFLCFVEILEFKFEVTSTTEAVGPEKM